MSEEKEEKLEGEITKEQYDELRNQSMGAPLYLPEASEISLINVEGFDCLVFGFIVGGQMVQFAYSDPDYALAHCRKGLDEFEKQLAQARKKNAN